MLSSHAVGLPQDHEIAGFSVRQVAAPMGVVPCPACWDVVLDLHQPCLLMDGRLIGVCEACGRWYLLAGFDRRAGVVFAVELPSDETIRRGDCSGDGPAGEFVGQEAG